MLIKPSSVAVAAGLTVAVCSAALAGNPFKDLTTTEGGYHTWDSDLINVDAVPQTGHGVYVAVLDTGLVPNGKTISRMRASRRSSVRLRPAVTFRSSSSNNPCGLEVEIGNLQQSTWVGSTGSTHGTHVTSTILGYSYRSNSDAAQDSRCRRSSCAESRRT
jgi:hypothetical protein